MKPSSLGGSLVFSVRPGYASGYAGGCNCCPSPTFSVSLFSLPLEGKLGARHWQRVETEIWNVGEQDSFPILGMDRAEIRPAHNSCHMNPEESLSCPGWKRPC